MRAIKMLILSLIIILLIAFSYNRASHQKPLFGQREILPYPSTFTLEASIYYVNNEAMLEPEHRTLIVKDNLLVEAIIAALQEAPSIEGCHRVISGDITVISSEIINNKLYLNLSKAFVDSPYWIGQRRHLVLYSLINSITQFDAISRVELTIEGKPINDYLDAKAIDGELTYNEAFTYQKPDSPEQVVLKFLNLISLSRFDSAYDMLENRAAIDKDQFIEAMNAYCQIKRNYEISRPFSKRNGSIIDVHVPYQYYDLTGNITYDGGTEIWQLREAGRENYHIIWPRKIE